MRWLRALTNLVMLTTALAGSQAMVFPGFGRGSDVEPGKTVVPVELLAPEGVQIHMKRKHRRASLVPCCCSSTIEEALVWPRKFGFGRLTRRTPSAPGPSAVRPYKAQSNC
jgi:hypothetical protein